MLASRRTGAIKGRIEVPGDKSITHRALMLGALASGTSRIAEPNTGEDVRATVSCLEALGATIAWEGLKSQVSVEGSGAAGLSGAGELYAGNSGTTIRLLAGLCAGIPGRHRLTGDASLNSRPMRRIVEPLRAMGARISGPDGGARPPLEVEGAPLVGIEHRSEVASAQVKSALLLAGLKAEGTTAVIEPAASRDHTERMLRACGVEVSVDGTRVSVAGGQAPGPMDWTVPGDISSAFFFVVAAAILPNSELTIERVGLNPTRIGGLEVLRSMGADIEWHPEGDPSVPEPSGTLLVRGSELKAIDIEGEVIPRAIDEIPALAIAATQAEGVTVIRGVGELRVKESDRLEGLAVLLRAVGASAEATGDSLEIGGPSRLTGGPVEVSGDHRMAMAAAIAGCVSDNDVIVEDDGAIATSFPEFPALLDQIRRST